jgi:DNA transposition AAA+ family ATPase
MATTTQCLNTQSASSIDEARALIRQCAEPCKAGELVKEAIFRASRRLEMPLSRARDIWYGDARRIDANEMDRLRRVAEEAELARALAALEFLKERTVASPSDEAIRQLRAALLAFQHSGSRIELPPV